MPWAASTSLALSLSMHSAEPSTPAPTKGTPASSSIPCTVPSSPCGPCSSGSTTTGTSSPTAGVTAGSGSIAVPVASRRSMPLRGRRELAGAAVERGDGVVGAHPVALAGDADGLEVVAVLVDGPQHVERRHARHLVLGRLAAEQHDEADAVGAGAWTECTRAACETRTACTCAPLSWPPRSAVASTGPTSRSTAPPTTPGPCGAGQLFVPIVAERDGHEFIAAALADGAAAYLDARARSTAARRSSWTTRRAPCRRRVGCARARLPSPVFGITGSVGKTSVKDLLAAVLSERLVHGGQRASFNNELGVPLTLLNAPDGTEAVVVEMGARGVGHIAELCAVARPTVGIVTRVARRAHRGVRHDRRRGARQGRARRGAAAPRHRGPQRRRPAGGGHGGAHVGHASSPSATAATSRAEDVTLDDELRADVRARVAVGAGAR